MEIISSKLVTSFLKSRPLFAQLFRLKVFSVLLDRFISGSMKKDKLKNTWYVPAVFVEKCLKNQLVGD